MMRAAHRRVATRVPYRYQRTRRLLLDKQPWWNWGARLKTIVGAVRMNVGDDPQPRTMWYRVPKPRRQRFTGYPVTCARDAWRTYDYQTMCEATTSLNEDEMYVYRAFGVGQDHELHLGHMFWGGRFYGCPGWEQRLLLWWLLKEQVRLMFGTRRALWSIGLKASIHAKKPFSCHQTPPGGYDHWHCRKRRGHVGPHKADGYEWEQR